MTRDAVNILKDCFSGSFAGIIFLGGTEKLVLDDLKGFFKEDIFVIKDLDSEFRNLCNELFLPIMERLEIDTNV